MLSILLLVSLAADPADEIPVPPEGIVQANAALVRDLFAADLAAAKTQPALESLAKRLLADADQTTKDHAGRYALLQLCRGVAIKAGDAKTAMDAVTRLSRFKLNQSALVLETMKGLAETCTTDSAAAVLARLADDHAKLMIRTDDYELATQIAAIAVHAGRQSHDSGLTRATVETSRTVTKYKAAYHNLGDNVTHLYEWGVRDGHVATAIGRFRCFQKDDWEYGLPLLQEGDDQRLKALAIGDLKKPTDPDELVRRGDAWLGLAGELLAEERSNVLARASFWYRQAVPKLVGLEKAKTARKLEDLANEIKRVSIMLAVTGEFKIANGKLRPNVSVAGWDTGDFVVAYITGDNMTGLELFVQVFDGNCRPASKPIKVNSQSVPLQPEPPENITDRVAGQAVAVGKHGQFAVVWNGWTAVGSNEQRVFCRLFNKTGKPLGQEFRVDGTEIRQTSPAVAFSTTANRLMVTWSQDADENADVMARLLRTSGFTDGRAFHVATTRNQGQHNPAIACDGFGRFVIAWWGTTAHDSEGIAFQRFDSTARPVGQETAVNDARGFRQLLPAVAAAHDGTFAVAWSTTQVWDGERPGGAAAPTADAVLARFFNGAGRPITSELRVGADKRAQAKWLYTAGVSMTPDGELAVVFNAVDDVGRNGVFLDRFSKTGVRLGGDISVAALDNTTDCSPTIITLQQGAVAVWQRVTAASAEIYGRHLALQWKAVETK